MTISDLKKKTFKDDTGHYKSCEGIQSPSPLMFNCKGKFQEKYDQYRSYFSLFLDVYQPEISIDHSYFFLHVYQARNYKQYLEDECIEDEGVTYRAAPPPYFKGKFHTCIHL